VRTVYLGTSEFAATVLDRLAGSAHKPALVVTRPDRRQGRGRKVSPPPVADRARELGIEVAQPGDVNSEEARAQVAAARPEAIAICAFGALIKEPLLTDHDWFNVHPSLLPRWRGAAPIERAIEAGDAETGVSIMRPTAELDAGPVFLTRAEPIEPDDDYGSLAPRLAALGGDLLVETLDSEPEPVAQPDDGVTYAEKIESSERRLDPARPAAELARKIRAFTPHIGAHVELPGEDRLRILAARPVAGQAPEGTLALDDGRLLFGTSAQALELLTVQPAGGNPMGAADWVRGRGAAIVA
jgi:methionyl-tRNA formyltransferase